MNSRTLTVLLFVTIGFTLLLMLPAIRGLRFIGVDQGYEPDQPIAFSHRLHAGELNISCLYCHFGAEKSRNAGVPSAQICMNCHKFVTAPLSDLRAEANAAQKDGRKTRPIISPEINKIYQACGLDSALKPNPAIKPAPIIWNRVHNLPDFSNFDHRPHSTAKIDCRQCHGPVETMERIRQETPLTMGWCISCHRNSMVERSPGNRTQVSIDCSKCHF